MSRPKKEIPPRKEHQITIRLTDELLEAITNDAKAAHLPRTEYIRSLITGKTPVIHQDVVFDSDKLLKVLGDMGKVGSNLNQIAHHLNGGGYFSESLEKEIKQGIVSLKNMRDMIKEIAGEYRERRD